MSVYITAQPLFWSITDYNTIYWSENIIFLPVFVLCWRCVLRVRAAMALRLPKTLLIRKGTERPVNSSSISQCQCVCVFDVQTELSSDLSSLSTFSRLKFSERFPWRREIHFQHQTFTVLSFFRTLLKFSLLLRFTFISIWDNHIGVLAL